MNDPRLSREDPDRTEPIRSFSGTFRPAGSAPGSEEADPAGGEDFVTAGVRLGYRLVEEQIRRGQQAARRMSGRFNTSRPDLRDLTERTLRLYCDLYTEAALSWFDVATTTATPADFPDPDEAASKASGPPSGGAAFIPVDVASSRPVRVSLNLRPGTEGQPLEVLQPRARDVTRPPLMNVAFASGADQPTLTIRIPDNQPADVYHGVVCHRDSGEPLGTLSIEIRPS